MSKDAKRDVAQEVTDLIISQLEQGVVPWQKPWSSSGGSLPRSMSTGKPYNGINSMLLGIYGSLAGYESPWWGTYKQISNLGGQVRKGEKGSTVVFYKRIPIEEEVNGKKVKKFIPLLRSFTVFNAAQADGLPEKYLTAPNVELAEHERIALAESIVSEYVANGPKLSHVVDGDRAYYRPSTDQVVMPALGGFDSPEGYYSTLFHELTHSTGHESRLNREGVVENHYFGSPLYAAEELVAELGAAMLCAEVGIDQAATIPNSASYIRSWLEALKNDKRLVLRASAKAQKATDLICGRAAAQAEDESGAESTAVAA